VIAIKTRVLNDTKILLLPKV